MNRLELSLAVAGIAFTGTVLLTILASFVGQETLKAAAVIGVGMGCLVWLVDFASDRWPKRA